MLCELCVDISVSLEKGGEDITVFQPTEIRTNTGSVSYPKGKRKCSRKPGQEPGNTEWIGPAEAAHRH